MSDILPNLNDPQAVTLAIEDNAAEWLLAMGRAGGGEECRESYIHWTIGGSPIDYHNAVVHTDLTQTTQSPDTVISGVIEQFKAHHLPGAWHVGPSMRPLDLGQRLVQHGFHDAGSEPGMAVNLLAVNESNESVNHTPQLTIERVRDEHQLDTWARTMAQGFGEGELEAEWVRVIYRKIGLGDDVPFRHFLARLDGQAVATSSLFLGAGVAGVYFVMTVPQARRQGIGAAITIAALREARHLGYRVGVLGSSQSGYPVYQRIGFKTYCQIGLYEWYLP
jgi:GNAT superfamily N-acetyltransferase